MPNFIKQYPQYERVGLKDLCDKIHAIYTQNNVAKLTTSMYLSELVPAMIPADAFAAMAHKKVERVAIDDLVGRVAAVMITPYPPGIPLLVPGEVFNETIVSYLRFARLFN